MLNNPTWTPYIKGSWVKKGVKQGAEGEIKPKKQPKHKEKQKMKENLHHFHVFTQTGPIPPSIHPSLPSSIHQLRYKKPRSVMTRPLPLSSTEAHCWSFINAQINLPLLSLSATVYLQSIYLCGYHSPCPIIMPPPPHIHPLLCPSPSICSPICSPSLLFTSFSISDASPVATLWVVIRENYASVANK